MTTLVKMKNVEKEIDDFTLGPVDLTIKPGTITALVGNNGSGKSTLLKLIMNLVKTKTGEIAVCDRAVGGTDESWKKQVAYQPQTTIGYDPFTGNQLHKLISRFYPTWDETEFRRIVDLFQVDLNKRFDKLSQGSQQKLTLALTIPRNADLLILDEPTAFMDIPSKKVLMDLLVEWMEEEERAIIIASHQAEDIRKLADYLVVLHDGHMKGNFTKEELTESYRRYWISGEMPASHIPGEVMREQNSIVTNEPTITEVFFKANDIDYSHPAAVELDEIITLLLTERKK